MKNRYILIGGFPWKAPDGGKKFAEELVKGFDQPVKILDCFFACDRKDWGESYIKDQGFFAKHMPEMRLEFEMAEPDRFAEQVRRADVVYIRGGSSESAIHLLGKDDSWKSYLGGKTVAGTSAGADAISKYYYDIDGLKVCEGLGLLPSKVIVHYKSDYNSPNVDWDKAYSDLQAYNENLPILALAEGEFKVIETD